MKKLVIFFTLAIFFISSAAMVPLKKQLQQNEVTFQEFYEQLAPYGQWIKDSQYRYIWVPEASPGFTPYLTNGYWLLTDYGWMWISNYDWGWAVFHYGRWDYNDSYGWFWVPENEWGPSWVTWRRSVGYYGWAPMKPGTSLSLAIGNYNDVTSEHWVFIKERDIESRDIEQNHLRREDNYKIFDNSTVINKTFYDDKNHATYVSGPSRSRVQKITGRTIQPICVLEKESPGQTFKDDELRIYRPKVQLNNDGYKPASSQIKETKDAKRISKGDNSQSPTTPSLNHPVNTGTGEVSETDLNGEKKEK